MIRTALYYPHTNISEPLLCTALLLWDRLEFVVPRENAIPYSAEPLFSEAFELIGASHVPNEFERKAVHREIEAFLDEPNLPKAFQYDATLASEEYGLYPETLLPETWELLRSRKLITVVPIGAPLTIPKSDRLVDWVRAGRWLAVDPAMMEAPGLGVAAILADCCAGETKRRVTDRLDSYRSLAELLCHGSSDAVSRATDESEALVHVNLPLIDTTSVGLKRLVEFRRRESREGGHSLRDLRHRYLDQVDAHMRTVATTLSKNPADLEEQNRIFLDDMKDDHRNLRDELRLEAKDVVFSKLLSKEVLCPVVVGAAALIALLNPVLAVTHLAGYVLSGSTATATIFGLLGSKNKFAKARKDILAKHPTAYVYELLGGSRI